MLFLIPSVATFALALLMPRRERAAVSISCGAWGEWELEEKLGIDHELGSAARRRECHAGCCRSRVPVAHREQIFERFWRGQSPRRRPRTRLAIVKEIMKAHQGTVTVADNVGGGSIFTLSFELGTTRVSCAEA